MGEPFRSRREDHQDEDGRTHLAHKAEHAVDLDSGAIVAVTVQDASIGDTGTIMDTLAEAEGQIVKLQRKAALESLVEGMQEVVADKGYHSGDDHALYNADRAFWAIRSSGVLLDGATTSGAVRVALEQKGITNRIDEGLSRECALLGLSVDELLSTSLTAMRKVPPGSRESSPKAP